jgi:hypothetical protein
MVQSVSALQRCEGSMWTVGGLWCLTVSTPAVQLMFCQRGLQELRGQQVRDEGGGVREEGEVG